MHMQNPLKQVSEVAIRRPRLAWELKAFFKSLIKTLKSLAHNHRLLLQNFVIIASRNPKKPIVDDTPAFRCLNSRFEGKPQWESWQHFHKNASQRPHVKDVRQLGVVFHPYVSFVCKLARQIILYFWRQVLGRGGAELILMIHYMTFGSQEEARAQVN